jgi:DNA-binding transcriptional ArsR family regulator
LAGEKNAPLDRILSSSGRIRILTLLSQVEQLHLTEIAKRTDQSYSATERHLGDLSQAGMVEERDYGRVRVFKLNLTNERAKLLQELILKWNHSQELGPVQAQA